MGDERSYVELNSRELARMRAIVGRLDEETARRPVNPHWTVAGVLGHIAFWDGRVLSLADKLDRGEPFAAGDADEDEDVDWNDDAFAAADPRRAAARACPARARDIRGDRHVRGRAAARAPLAAGPRQPDQRRVSHPPQRASR